MFRFLVRRLLVAGPTLLLVVAAAFVMMRMAPGNPFQAERRLPPEIERNVMARYGLDRPLPEQLVRYVGGVAHGDFGPSLKYIDKPVTEIIAEGFPVSAILGVSALVVGLGCGVALGVLAAVRRNRPSDHLATGAAMLGVCVPTFVTAPLLVLLFGSTLGWLPTGSWNGGALRNLILPVAVLALPQIAVIARLTRAGMIEALSSNAVRTARAKGLGEYRVVTRHALRPALIPLVSYLGPATAGLITGSLVVERIFRLPGLGKSFVDGALQRDYTLVMGVVILYAALILALNLAADLLVAVLDPRVRLA